MIFSRAVAFVIMQEGGLVNDPRDPGGITNMGIALKRHAELTPEDIRTMTVARATDIYQNSYWKLIQGDSWPDPVAFVLFDMAVNMGTIAAISCLQIAAGVNVDGIIGPETLDRVRAQDAKTISIKLTSERIKRYTKMDIFPIYGNGWLLRSIKAVIEANA